MRRLQLALGVVAIAMVFAGGAWYGLSRADTGSANASTPSASPSVDPKPTLVGGIPSGTPSGGPTRSAPATGAHAQLSAAQKLAEATAAQIKAKAAKPGPFSLRIASFNILGSQHTARGGQRASMAPGTVRAGWASGLISSLGLDIVGFGEMQPDQYSTLMSRSPEFSAYPGTGLGSAGVATNLIWRASRFDLVDASYLQINFLGQRRLMPIVLLKEKATGRTFYVFNVHNSPVQARGTHQGERNVQMAAEIATIKKLRATGLPVFFLGDMNEHAEVFCKVTGATDLTSPAGGSSAGGGCRAPGVMRVDWIFGNGEWTSYALDRSAPIRRITDHTVLLADVRVT